MNIIVVSRSRGQSVRRSLHAPHHFIALALVAMVALAAAVGAGYAVGRWQKAGSYVATWQARLAAQQEALAEIRQQTREQVNALSVQLARLQARMTRIDAIGRRLIAISGIEGDEFDFDAPPGMGGPEYVTTAAVDARVPELAAAIEDLAERMSQRERQLRVLGDVLMERALAAATIPAGWPVEEGWISSGYGYREDPFGGGPDFHEGIDIATRAGMPVHAVAAGVVTLAGWVSGYGKMVEITHGDGYVTRYGHNGKILVEVGQLVRRGDVIAKAGSTGRSTGPHVHLEILRYGEPINPWKYVQAGS